MLPVLNKQQMYKLLASGEFGNTIPQYSSLEEWRSSGDHLRYDWWGVRTKTTGGPCKLNCPVRLVSETVRKFAPHPPNISVMISAVGQVTWLGDIWDSPTGIIASGIEYPVRIHDWRDLMKRPSRWEGVSAKCLLKRHLNPNSHDDLMQLIDKYPEHIYELSAMDVCFGVVPHRNAIMWEVRKY